MFDTFLAANLAAAAPGGGGSAADAAGDAVDNVTEWWQDEHMQQWLIARPLKILLVIVLAVIAQWVCRRIINKLAAKARTAPKPNLRRPTPASARGEAREQAAEMSALDKAKEARRQSRITTLAGVGRSAVAIVVWTITGLITLQTLTINIAPLIASAGVVSVALGFGAQSLVKDFLSGIFMLIEDQYGIGDVVQLEDGIIGEVEDITLRVTKVRDIDGTLWTVRNGDIMSVGNFSDQYAICRLQIPVGLSNNATDAWEVIDRAIHEAVRDPAIRGDVLAEPVLDGISEWEPDHISYRISIKTMPGQQWHVQRHSQVHVLNAMQDAGIRVPYPHGMGAAQYVANEKKED